MTRYFLAFVLMLLVPVGGNYPSFAQEDMLMAGCPETEGAPVWGPIEEYTAGYSTTVGLFTYYTDQITRRVLVSVRPDQMDHVFLVSTTLSKGTGDMNFAAPMMWSNTAIQFQRNGNNVEVIQPNFTITTVMGEPMARAVESGISDTIIATIPIEAEDPNDGRLVFDLSTVLLGSTGIDAASWTFAYSYSVDLMNSYIEQIKGFPENDEIDVRVPIYGAADAIGNVPMGTQLLGFHFSLSEPPPPGYLPRLADDRVGIFLNVSMNYSQATDMADTRYVRYINRYRLEKADPDAGMSDPVEPIVFWLDNSIPYEYRDAVRDGILAWNIAFEKIGFRNAIQVKEMPEDADWDPADIRYNTVRWFVSPQSVYAIGPSLSDPRTGETYDGDIGVNADMISSIFTQWDLEMEPLKGALDTLFPPGWPNLGFRQVRWDDNTRRILDAQMSRAESRGMGDPYAVLHAFDAARAYTLLQGTGRMEPGSEDEAQFVHDYIASLIMHEIGHVIGLRHNFCGSAGTPYWKLNQTFYTRRHGLSQSIMDYTMTNIAAPGQPQGEYFQTVPGDYDCWAIAYAYSDLNLSTSEEELTALNEIASRAPMYRYGTDHDAYGWTQNMDPDAYMWDLGDDPVRYYRDQVLIGQHLINGILDYWNEPGTRPVKIRQAFMYAYWNYFLAAAAVPRVIGGVRFYRDHIGDPGAHPAMIPASAEEQRYALQFLRDVLWASESYQFDPELLNMLARERWESFDWMNLYYGDRDFNLHDYVLLTQADPLYWIYDPVVLGRVLNNEHRMPAGQEAFTLIELFNTVRNSIWTELGDNAVAPTTIDSFRRNLQRAHLEMLTGIVLNPANGTPEDGVTLARHDLLVLKDRLTNILANNSRYNLDQMTIAHLDECLSRINLTLVAPMERGGNDFSFLIY